MIEDYAKKTFLALKNPYQTVTAVYPGVIDEVNSALAEFGYAGYTGYKDTEMIPQALIRQFNRQGFLMHTKDRMALGGRAVDLQLVNPLTGGWMSGSSSGTALNVFYGINDLGVGTDGGGSVLAPAAALNLYGFISPAICREHLNAWPRRSTDNIAFYPSIGFIARDLAVIRRAAAATAELPALNGSKTAGTRFIPVPRAVDIYGPREGLISYVKETVKAGTVLVSREGPVDLLGIGDSIFGHFDEHTRARQKLGKKGLMRVANMCGMTALCVPSGELGRCTVFLSTGNAEDIINMFARAEEIMVPPSPLVERYFLNLNMYF